ncbi:hypothetical protein CGMCC3_g17844 [Colletotrichum fructicola]|nr:uncharacterized protein CGMCC3_g17844 [Colletotrichum fructicola]KAE9565972.1 hypothetical protein CGMCC3_g17844 [Colletotrichum fructicola]
MVAEVANSANNTISGIIYIREQRLQRATACVLNGVVGQLSVQASDFSILAIAIATLLVIRRKTSMADGSSLEKLAICCCVWVVPITTSALAARMGVMEPVSGNWCWITQDRPDLRFALAHVWRLWIMFTTVCIYAFVWRYLSQHLRATASTSWLSCDAESSTVRMTTALFVTATTVPKPQGDRSTQTGLVWAKTMRCSESPLSSASEHALSRYSGELDSRWGGTAGEQRAQRVGQLAPHAPSVAGVREGKTPRTTARSGALQQDENEYNSRGGGASRSYTPQPWAAARLRGYGRNPGWGTTVVDDGVSSDVSAATMANLSIEKQTRTLERRAKRMMLLNSCPILYIILWIPSLLHGIIEASGAKTHGSLSAALQISSQFVGFANAVTYCFRESVACMSGDSDGYWLHQRL